MASPWMTRMPTPWEMLRLAVFTAYHLYDNDNLRIAVASFDEVRDLFHAMLAGSLAFLILSQGVKYVADWWIYTAVEAFLFIAAALVLVPVVRGSLRSWVLPRVMQRRRTLIVGSGHEARVVHRKLAAHPEYGLEVVGFLDGEDGDRDGVPGPVLGSLDEIATIIDEHEIDRVVLASSIASHEEMLDLVRTVRRPDVQVSIVPRYFEIFTSRAILDEVEGMPVVTLPPMRNISLVPSTPMTSPSRGPSSSASTIAIFALSVGCAGTFHTNVSPAGRSRPSIDHVRPPLVDSRIAIQIGCTSSGVTQRITKSSPGWR